MISIRTYYYFFWWGEGGGTVLGFEIRASILLGSHSTQMSHSTSPAFVLGIFEIGFLEQFARIGFEQ
jgi:hypothetical protein